jgi:hypothetical protein
VWGVAELVQRMKADDKCLLLENPEHRQRFNSTMMQLEVVIKDLNCILIGAQHSPAAATCHVGIPQNLLTSLKFQRHNCPKSSRSVNNKNFGISRNFELLNRLAKLFKHQLMTLTPKGKFNCHVRE